MSLEIDGQVFFSSGDLLNSLGVSRQTIWRWRKEGKIPQGHRHRSGKVVFTKEEAKEIAAYANRIEPILHT